MSKFLRVDDSFMDEFRSQLRASITLGPILLRRNIPFEGALRVWVPAECTSIEHGNLQTVIFYPEQFSGREDRYRFVNNYFLTNPDGVLVACTPRERSWNNSVLGKLQWFSCDSPYGSSERPILIYLRSEDANSDVYKEIGHWSSSYPSTWILSLLQHRVEIQASAHYTLDSDVIEAILEGVEHVLVGVFDERTTMVWSRSAREE